MNCLNANGFTDEYLSECFIGFASDGASVMLGKKSGVATRLKARFPQLMTWHCLNHRLELAVNDAVKSCTQINVTWSENMSQAQFGSNGVNKRNCKASVGSNVYRTTFVW